MEAKVGYKIQRLWILKKPLTRIPDIWKGSGTVLNREAAVRFWVSGVGSPLWGAVDTPAFPMKSEADSTLHLWILSFCSSPHKSSRTFNLHHPWWNKVRSFQCLKILEDSLCNVNRHLQCCCRAMTSGVLNKLNCDQAKRQKTKVVHG